MHLLYKVCITQLNLISCSNKNMTQTDTHESIIEADELLWLLSSSSSSKGSLQLLPYLRVPIDEGHESPSVKTIGNSQFNLEHVLLTGSKHLSIDTLSLKYLSVLGQLHFFQYLHHL